MSKRLRVVVFSGGRGTATLTDAMLAHGQIDLTVLVNAYDDGLSTGFLRRYIPGMLGPSDVRKNASRLVASSDRSAVACRQLLEHRLPKPFDADQGLGVLRAMAQGCAPDQDPKLAAMYRELRLSQLEPLRTWLAALTTYIEAAMVAGRPFEFGDCSVGNLVMAGQYLCSGRDFNATCALLCQWAETRGEVVNVTDGANLVLVALKEDGAWLHDEASIVSQQNAVALSDIYLLPDYLGGDDERALLAHDAAGRRTFLAERHVTPRLGARAAEVLRDADIIIYGPGTQHSSLLPSYLTAGVAEAIAANKGAEKLYISNLLQDHEIQGETVNSLIDKLLAYLNRRGQAQFAFDDLVSCCFLQVVRQDAATDTRYMRFEPERFAYDPAKVVLANWEDRQGGHSGGRVLDEIIGLVNRRLTRALPPYHYKVSVIVPGLNEAPTVGKVLHDLSLVNLQEYGLGLEIIYADGGSTDGSWEIARGVAGVTCVQADGSKGRGRALRAGVAEASGNILVFFPSDDEYDIDGLLAVVLGVHRTKYPMVIGSRGIKILNISTVLRAIYRGKYWTFLVSKYGGLAVSLSSLLLFNRWVSDVFSSVKAFDARAYRSLALSSDGMDLDTEIVAKACLAGHYIVEVPVAFTPRTWRQGKKTTVGGGLRALWRMYACKLAGWRPGSAANEAGT